MKRAVLTALALFAFACGGGESSPQKRAVTVKGSDTMVILTQRLAEEYMARNRGETVQVNGGGSGTGIAALINGSTDIAQASRPMKDEERAGARKNRGADVVEVPVAIDALAVFVNAANPVKELTVSQIAGIYRGTLTNWQQVGGPDAEIVLYGRESSSGTYDYFKEHVLSKADFSSKTQTLQGTAAIINAVSKDRSGIGYGGIAYAREVRALAIRTEKASSGITPTEGSVKDGTYPLSRKLFFYHLAGAPERVTKFVRWALTPEAQALVSRVGYFPLRDASGPQ